ncbi:Crp/Fnr family transcriptional regulator [Pedobacter sp. BMA]|uniref:Crp/Fnr family transcriptional regulator n=1 Tax=Pedobacter sp. BMA TaxID=1663685 RepID=UPI00064B62B4|nr:Crp/Fnr family transcriptional regulator [Pedobacter sp. BMA]KLT63938.1 cyclic nucleotide-binding protein [Pedobacter sp. BMA]
MEDSDLQKLKNIICSFVDVPQDEWELLVPHLKYQEVKKGDDWITEGKLETKIGFLLSGTMRHYYTHDGEQKTTYFYFENHLTGSYFSALTHSPSKLTIQALTDCYLLAFPYKILVALFDQSKVWERFGRKLAEYLVLGLEERMVDLLILSPEERYLQLLAGTKTKIIEQIPQHLIANYLGVSAVSLSRIRKRVTAKKID